MAEKIFFFDREGDARKVTCTEDEIQSMEDLVLMALEKYSDVGLESTDMKLWTKDQTYNVRHKVSSPKDIYNGAVLEVTLGSEHKRKRVEDKKGAKPKRPRKTGPRFILRLRGLPWSANLKKVKEFFSELELVEAKILNRPDGRSTGEALVEFKNEEDLEKGLEKDKENIGDRYIEVFKASGEEMDRALGLFQDEIKDLNNKVLRMRGLPYTTTEKDILEFFSEGDLKPAAVHIISDRATGRTSGVALVEFETEDEIVSALDLNRNEIGNRYIELFRGTIGELKAAVGQEQAASGSGITGGMGGQFGGGSGESCIKMRGLPFNTTDSDIAMFFEVAGVMPQRIHKKADGSEAYVEFNAADVEKAMTRQKSYIGHRYIELYRVSYQEVASIVGLPARAPFRRGPFF